MTDKERRHAHRAAGRCGCGRQTAPKRRQCPNCYARSVRTRVARIDDPETRPNLSDTCECSARKAPCAEACPRCVDLDGGRGPRGALIAVLRMLGRTACAAAVRDAMTERQYYRGLAVCLRDGTVVRRGYDAEGGRVSTARRWGRAAPRYELLYLRRG